MRTETEIRRDIRTTRATMKAKGIRRLSFMNGGHTADSAQLNFEMCRLESELKQIKAAKQ
jgi:hypothetical protein